MVEEHSSHLLPPPIALPNVYPVEWHTDTPRLAELYRRALHDRWDPAELPWESLDFSAYSSEQRTALAYWFGLLANFEFSGPSVFARAMIEAYKEHREDPVRRLFGSVVADEINHEEVCQRMCNACIPGWPTVAPTDPLQAAALRNLKWVYHNGARYWKGVERAFDRYPLPILFTSFLMGEVAATTLFLQMSRAAAHPLFSAIFQRIGRDESRHTGFALELAKQAFPGLTPEQKGQITRQIRAGYVFLSMILYVPPTTDFWQLPPDFTDVHLQLEEILATTGMGLRPLADRRQNWRDSLLRVKAVVEPHGIAFPAIPEVDITGQEVALDPNELVVPFL